MAVPIYSIWHSNSLHSYLTTRFQNLLLKKEFLIDLLQTYMYTAVCLTDAPTPSSRNFRAIQQSDHHSVLSYTFLARKEVSSR